MKFKDIKIVWLYFEGKPVLSYRVGDTMVRTKVKSIKLLTDESQKGILIEFTNSIQEFWNVPFLAEYENPHQTQ